MSDSVNNNGSTIKPRRKRGRVSRGNLPSDSDNRAEYVELVIRLPLLPFSGGSVCTHMNVQSMSPKMRVACERIKRGCRAMNANTENGRPVITAVDTARFIFEQIADSLNLSDEDVDEAFG